MITPIVMFGGAMVGGAAIEWTLKTMGRHDLAKAVIYGVTIGGALVVLYKGIELFRYASFLFL